jgi:hypothetical protein
MNLKIENTALLVATSFALVVATFTGAGLLGALIGMALTSF